jgi:hypothetical protein
LVQLSIHTSEYIVSGAIRNSVQSFNWDWQTVVHLNRVCIYPKCTYKEWTIIGHQTCFLLISRQQSTFICVLCLLPGLAPPTLSLCLYLVNHLTNSLAVLWLGGRSCSGSGWFQTIACRAEAERTVYDVAGVFRAFL